MRKSIRLNVSVAAVFCLGCVAADGSLGSARAADNWTGFYIGANAGYAWSDRSAGYSANDPVSRSLFGGNPIAGNTALPNTSFDVSGGFGGVQAGYNWQFNPRWVFGIEADIDFGNIKGNGTSLNIIGAGPIPSTAAVSEKIEWFGTVRARLGFLVTNELLIYGTGGFAYGRVEQEANWTAPFTGTLGVGAFGVGCIANVPCYVGSSSSVQTGWTAGAGGEWAIWKNWTLKAEYLYVNLGPNAFVMSGAVTPPGALQSSATVSSGDVDFHTVRAGLNLRF